MNPDPTSRSKLQANLVFSRIQSFESILVLKVNAQYIKNRKTTQTKWNNRFWCWPNGLKVPSMGYRLVYLWQITSDFVTQWVERQWCCAMGRVFESHQRPCFFFFRKTNFHRRIKLNWPYFHPLLSIHRSIRKSLVAVWWQTHRKTKNAYIQVHIESHIQWKHEL
jgi:hypothetical protein